MPSRNTIVDWEPWKSIGMHKIPVNNFIVFYTVTDKNKSVTIIRILYSGRNIEDIATKTINE